MDSKPTTSLAHVTGTPARRASFPGRVRRRGLTRKDRARLPLRLALCAGASVAAAGGLANGLLGGATGPVAAVAVAALWIVFVAVHGLATLRVLATEQAALSALAPLRGDEPYPVNPASLSPENALILCQELMARRPRRVLELGSGASTLMIARVLDLLGEDGRVVSLEHLEPFQREAAARVARAGLEHRASVVHAPLVPHAGSPEPWYDLTALDEAEGPFDLVLVDGPEGGHRAPLARYGALPLLRDRLSPGAVLLLDDGLRRGEREVVERWRALEPGLRARLEATFDGLWVVELPPDA